MLNWDQGSHYIIIAMQVLQPFSPAAATSRSHRLISRLTSSSEVAPHVESSTSSLTPIKLIFIALLVLLWASVLFLFWWKSFLTFFFILFQKLLSFFFLQLYIDYFIKTFCYLWQCEVPYNCKNTEYSASTFSYNQSCNLTTFLPFFLPPSPSPQHRDKIT